MSLDIGLDIGGTNIKIGVVDGEGQVKARRRLKTRAKSGPGQALERTARAISDLRKGRTVRSVGVGIAGLVDHEHGIVRVPPNLPGWNGTAVKEILEDKTGLPVSCTNDANAVTLGEWLYGAGQGHDNMFCMTLGTGVGGGAVVHGQLAIGANDAAGELGHTVIFGNGLPCSCGGRGCLERYVGAGHIVKRARARVRAQVKQLSDHREQLPMFRGMLFEKPSVLSEKLRDRMTTEDVGRAARDGDALALELVEEVGHYVGLGLVNVVALFDPELIVIGGGMAGFGKPLMAAVRQTVLSRGQIFTGRTLEFAFAKLGNDAGIVGASRIAGNLGALRA